MELHLAQYGFLHLAVQLNLDDVGVRRVDKRFYGLYIDGKSQIFATAIDYAWNQSCVASGLGCLLAEIGTSGCLQFDCLHNSLFFNMLPSAALNAHPRCAPHNRLFPSAKVILFSKTAKKSLYLPTAASSSATVTGMRLSPIVRPPLSVTSMSSSMRMPPKSRYASSAS